MIGEFSDSTPGDLSPNNFVASKDQKTLPLADNETLIKMFDAGFRRLPTLYGGGMDKTFDRYFPFGIAPWKLGGGRKIFQSVFHQSSDKEINPVELDQVNEFKQQNGSDCVGTAVISAFSTITGVSITPEIYDGFLQIALKRGLAERDDEGIKVLPFTFNAFSTPEFKQSFPAPEVTVAYRRGLSLEELSEIVRAAKAKKNPAYKTFVFLPFSSWVNPGGGHLVTLRKIGPTETTVYDPRVGEERVIPNTDFNQKWEHDNKSAIFVFVK